MFNELKIKSMRRIFLMLTLAVSVITANAQEVTEGSATIIETKPTTGEYYQGFTRPLTFDRMIPPYALEVTFNKTVHVIFPAPIRYVDLGSADLLAAKADGTENVLRVKAALRDFSRERRSPGKIRYTVSCYRREQNVV